MRGAALLLLGLALAPITAAANVLIVPDDHATVQAAVDAAASGDEVAIRPGSYPEAVVIFDKSLRIYGLGGRWGLMPGPTADGIRVRERLNPQTVIISDLDVVGARRGIFAKRVGFFELNDVVVSGCRSGGLVKVETFAMNSCTITGSTKGPGLKISAAGPKVRDSVVTGNLKGGLKIKSKNGLLEVRDSVVTDNGKSGLAIVSKGGLDLLRNDLSRNEQSGVILKARVSPPTIEDNQADDNGIYGFDVDSDIGGISEASLLADGNTASGNGVQDFHIR